MSRRRSRLTTVSVLILVVLAGAAVPATATAGGGQDGCVVEVAPGKSEPISVRCYATLAENVASATGGGCSWAAAWRRAR